MRELLFGTAGIPLCVEGDTVEGIKKVKALGLEAMELEFVRNINISKEKAPKVRETALKNSVVLTCHAPYYINLNSMENEKIEASKKRILASALKAWECGAWSLCFHAGYYSGISKSLVYKKIKDSISEIVEELKNNRVKIWVRPEISGKRSQFGSLEELISLSLELDLVMPCVDFAHLHARNGKNNTYEEFKKILEIIENSLGKFAIENMHIHISGIEYGNKGEKRHLNLEESDLKYSELLKALKDFKAKGVIISESPNIEQDAILMKKIYNEV